MLDKLPVSMANMDSLGFPSFLTKQMQISFRIKAGANSIITRKYVFVIEKTALSAPKREVISPERKKPAAINIKAARIPVYTVFVKTVFVSHDDSQHQPCSMYKAVNRNRQIQCRQTIRPQSL